MLVSSVKFNPAKVGVASVFKSCAPILPSTVEILVEKLPLSVFKPVTLVEKLAEAACRISTLDSSVVSLVEKLPLSSAWFVLNRDPVTIRDQLRLNEPVKLGFNCCDLIFANLFLSYHPTIFVRCGIFSFYVQQF